MNDFVKVQEFFTQGLLCEDYLAAINVLQYRKLRLESVVDWSVIWQRPRVPLVNPDGSHSSDMNAGRSGCGILVEMPSFKVLHPNLGGPPGFLVASAVVVEEPNLNMTPETGTLLSAEEVSKFILDSTHQWVVGSVGILTAERNAIEPTEEFDGLVAYRVNLSMQAPQCKRKRVAGTDITLMGQNVTLTSITDGADIYFTTDGSFPGPSNAAAIKYSEPFDFAGRILLTAAYKPGAGMLRSNVESYEVPES